MTKTSVISFKDYLKEETKVVYFTFGRMNPPTAGHGKMFDTLREYAGKHPYKIYMSHRHDSNKNPLLYEEKLKVTRKFFPKHGRHIIESKVNNILEAAVDLYDKGYKKIVLVVGEDRKYEFETLLNKYNGVRKEHGLYVFESISVISAGMRDPDAKDVSGISSSKLRESVRTSNFVEFSQGLPKNITTSEAKYLYNKVRIGLGLNEEKNFRINPQISKTDLREKYVNGGLFKIGDRVLVNESDEIFKITILGSNYVIVEGADKKRHRKWITDVTKFEG